MTSEGGTPARAGQLSTRSGVGHELLVDGGVGNWLDDSKDGDRSDLEEY